MAGGDYSIDFANLYWGKRTVTLQWATYRDAADQCSPSRIRGGIHPPADDIPGRHIGEQVGQDAFALASAYFDGAG